MRRWRGLQLGNYVMLMAFVAPTRVTRVSMTALRAPVVLLLVVIAGCKWPSAGLKSEFQDEKSVSSADTLEKATQRELARLPDEGHCDPSTAPATNLSSSSFFKKTKKEDPGFNLTQLSIEKLLQRGYAASKRGSIDEAKQAYLEVLRRQPDHGVAHHRLAVMADKQGDFKTAEFHYQSALRSQASDPNLLNDVGYSYLLQGDYQQSEQFFGEAIAIKPDHRQAVNNLALLQSMKGNYDSAAETLRRVHTDDEVSEKLAKLFPSGRPQEQSGPEQGGTVTPVSSPPAAAPLHAPEFQVAAPSTTTDNRATANTAIAKNVVPADSQIPTAAFTGQVVAEPTTINAVGTEPASPLGATPGNVPAQYTSDMPSVRHLNQPQTVPMTAPQTIQTMPQQQAEPTEWNRVTFSFDHASRSNGMTVPSDPSHANVPVAVSNAAYVVDPSRGNATSPQPSTISPTELVDPRASMAVQRLDAGARVQPAHDSPQERMVIAPALSSNTYGAHTPLPTHSPLMTATGRELLVLGLNAGPGTLFPVLDINTSTSQADYNSPQTERRRDSTTFPVDSPTNIEGDSSLILQPADGSAARPAHPKPTPSQSTTFGLPQYPSATHHPTSVDNPYSLPRTVEPARPRSAVPSGSFEAMP